jgi:hypothetical protein
MNCRRRVTSHRILLRLKVLSFAGVAQLVEQLICNQLVGGSSPLTGSIKLNHISKLNIGIANA